MSCNYAEIVGTLTRSLDFVCSLQTAADVDRLAEQEVGRGLSGRDGMLGLKNKSVGLLECVGWLSKRLSG